MYVTQSPTIQLFIIILTNIENMSGCCNNVDAINLLHLHSDVYLYPIYRNMADELAKHANCHCAHVSDYYIKPSESIISSNLSCLVNSQCEITLVIQITKLFETILINLLILC